MTKKKNKKLKAIEKVLNSYAEAPKTFPKERVKEVWKVALQDPELKFLLYAQTQLYNSGADKRFNRLLMEIARILHGYACFEDDIYIFNRVAGTLEIIPHK